MRNIYMGYNEKNPTTFGELMFQNLKTKINRLDKETVGMSISMLAVPVTAVAGVVCVGMMFKNHDDKN